MQNNNNDLILAHVKHKIASAVNLPEMPVIAQSLLSLSQQPNHDISRLINIIELDPSLAAQLIRYSKSNIFSPNVRVKSLHQAIDSILGFNLTLGMALGLSMCRAFENPGEGIYSLHSFWKHAIYTAIICEQLAHHMPEDIKPDNGDAFLCGLIHDFGSLLFGHLFHRELLLLKQIARANKDIPIVYLEQQVLGVNHTQMGAQLMSQWNMPKIIQVTVSQHHNEDYRGPYAHMSLLILVVDRLLRQRHHGDACNGNIPSHINALLGLTTHCQKGVVETVFSFEPEMDGLTQQFIACH